MRMRLAHALMLLTLLFAVMLLAGCPKSSPTESTAVVPEGGMAADQPPVVEGAEPGAGAPEGEEAEAETAEEMPTGLKGKLTVGVPCGLAMAYKAARDLFKEANPEVEFVDHVKNVQPMVRELMDKKVEMDVFLSLGDIEMGRLIKQGLIEGEGTGFLTQRMHLTVKLGNPLGIEKLEDLLKDEVKTVAVCDPSLSIGYYGQKALEAAGVWDELEAAKKIVRPDQPVKAKNLVIEGKADAAFTYAACANENWEDEAEALSLKDKADPLFLVDEELYGGMPAVAGIPAGAPDPELAKAFIKALLSDEVQAKMEEMGYGKAKKGEDKTACESSPSAPLNIS